MQLNYLYKFVFVCSVGLLTLCDWLKAQDATNQDDIQSSSVVGKAISEHKDVHASGGLGTTSVLQDGFIRWMVVNIKQDEQSYSSMKAGSARVLNDSGTTAGSSWVPGIFDGGWMPHGYGGKKGVIFRGLQKPNATIKGYKPEFLGTVVLSGGGGGTSPAEYDWNIINADYEIKDIEIYRSIAGGPFIKISDVQNVDPVIVGQKITLKVTGPNAQNLDNNNVIQWNIGGPKKVQGYNFNPNMSYVLEVLPVHLKQREINYYYVLGGNTTISVSISKPGMNPCSKSTVFSVLRPTVDFNQSRIDETNLVPQIDIRQGTISVGSAEQAFINAGMSCKAYISTPNNGQGTINIVQIITAYQTELRNTINRELLKPSQPVFPCLDFFMSSNIGSNTTDFMTNTDSPAFHIRSGYDHIKYNENFSTFLMYQPSTSENPAIDDNNSIPVPLAKFSWNFISTTKKTTVWTTQSPQNINIPANNKWSSCDDFPIWNANRSVLSAFNTFPYTDP